MRKNHAASGRVPLYLLLFLVLVLLGAMGAVAHFVRPGSSTRRTSDSKAVLALPPGSRPGRLLSKPLKKTGQTQARMIKHTRLTTQLATLAQVVPQDATPIPRGQEAHLPAGFSQSLLPKLVRDSVRAGLMRLSNEGQVQVYIRVSDTSDDIVGALETSGARLELVDKESGIVQASVPANRLEAVAATPSVNLVRLPDYGVPNTGSVTSQGDALLNADQVRSLFGVDGTGVTVGVISNGIAGIIEDGGCLLCGGAPGGPIETGDLPAATGVRNAGVLTSTSGGLMALSFRADNDLEAGLGGGMGAEGTAMLEIIHDLAPGAQLRFANFSTSLEFILAVDFLSANSDIVVDDISFFGTPYDGTSLASANTGVVLNADFNPIRAYFTSVGNHAQIHYQEDFFDSGMDGTPLVGVPGNLHLFQATGDTSDVMGSGPDIGDAIFLCDTSGTGGICNQPPGQFDTVVVQLVWDDPFGASSNDYDLYLLDSAGVPVASFGGTNAQTGTQNPVETLVFVNNTGVDDFFFVVIQNVDNRAAVVNFDMFILEPNGQMTLAPTGEVHNFNTVSSSVAAQSDAGGSPVSVISVGAIDAADPGSDDIEDFSSNGPTNDLRLKPDGTAIDGVAVTGAAGFPSTFFGTSAAAPHGAAIAALLLQAAPCLQRNPTGVLLPASARERLRDLILNNAVDLGSSGDDQAFGFGRLDALASANQTPPSADAGTGLVLAGNSPTGRSVTFDATASSDPNGCPLTFGWSGDCGAATDATPILVCPIGVNTVDLTVSNGAPLAQPISSTSVDVTVTDFALAIDPPTVAVDAGQDASFTVDLSPLFGAYDESIVLSCSNLPTAASCSFSPPSVTPGVTGASSTLTVSTTAPAASWRPPREPARTVFAVWLGLSALVLLATVLGGRGPRKCSWALVALLALWLVFLGGCGGGDEEFVPQSSTPAPTPSTPSGTHVFTITGTNGSLVHSLTAELIVN